MSITLLVTSSGSGRCSGSVQWQCQCGSGSASAVAVPVPVAVAVQVQMPDVAVDDNVGTAPTLVVVVDTALTMTIMKGSHAMVLVLLAESIPQRPVQMPSISPGLVEAAIGSTIQVGVWNCDWAAVEDTEMGNQITLVLVPHVHVLGGGTDATARALIDHPAVHALKKRQCPLPVCPRFGLPASRPLRMSCASHHRATRQHGPQRVVPRGAWDAQRQH